MQIIIIAHDIRSAHNIGSIIRTAECFGVSAVYCTGYTPYPTEENDERLPHIRDKITRDITKTSLGAEKSIPVIHAGLHTTIAKLRNDGFSIVGLEQSHQSIYLSAYSPPQKLALILGREVEGIEPEILEVCDDIVEIPMSGTKESFNVSVACGIALYGLLRP